MSREKCKECGKPLGNTEVYCFEHGGNKVQPTREERLRDAVWWKVELGVRYKYIEAAHE